MFCIVNSTFCAVSTLRLAALTIAAPPAASATPSATARRDGESAGSPGQKLDNQRNLLVGQIRALVLHASDRSGPPGIVRRLVLHAVERMARGANRVHEVRGNGIGTPGSGSRAIGRLGQNREWNYVPRHRISLTGKSSQCTMKI
jgi:hypothetical protein